MNRKGRSTCLALLLASMLVTGCGSPGSTNSATGSAAAGSAAAPPAAAAPVAELVEPARLQALLPEVPGWTRSAPQSGRLSSPIPLSQASVVYQKDGATVDFKIIDAGGNQRLFQPFASLLARGAGTETKDGFERGVSIDGYPAWEKWDAGTRNGEIGVDVERRFLVQLEGRRVESINALRAIMDATDITGLAAVR
jgi:hypothetical protein